MLPSVLTIQTISNAVLFRDVQARVPTPYVLGRTNAPDIGREEYLQVNQTLPLAGGRDDLHVICVVNQY